MKRCSKCGIEKDEKEFYKDKRHSDGLKSACKVCHCIETKIYSKNNPEIRSKIAEKYRKTHSEQVRDLQRNWVKQNPEYHKTYKKNKYQNDIQFKIADNISSNIYEALKSKKTGRHWEDLVGYTIYDLIKHLEYQFKLGMTWDNHGSYWEIDHIRPKSWFDQNDPEQFKACWGLNNLQPLKKSLNRSKGNRWEG
jgi:hypothetical protein